MFSSRLPELFEMPPKHDASGPKGGDDASSRANERTERGFKGEILPSPDSSPIRISSCLNLIVTNS